MDIKKAFKSRLLFVVTAIFLVFGAISVLAAKTTNDPSQNLCGQWRGKVAGGTLAIKINSIPKTNKLSGKLSYEKGNKKGVFDINKGPSHYYGKEGIIYTKMAQGEIVTISFKYSGGDRIKIMSFRKQGVPVASGTLYRCKPCI